MYFLQEILEKCYERFGIWNYDTNINASSLYLYIIVIFLNICKYMKDD